jgi:hypothetical protein
MEKLLIILSTELLCDFSYSLRKVMTRSLRKDGNQYKRKGIFTTEINILILNVGAIQNF